MVQEEYTNIEQICFVFTIKYTKKSNNVIVKVTKSKYFGFVFCQWYSMLNIQTTTLISYKKRLK